MRRLNLCAISALALALPAAVAQQPPAKLPVEVVKPTTEASVKQELTLTKFDPHAAEVRLANRRWQLWSGKTMLKDFGDNRNAAYEARRLVADLKLDARGAIGTPEPVMEYWLSGGEAPPLPGLSRMLVPFDPGKIRVIDDNGSYKVGDDRRVLFDFGPHAADAVQALAIIQRYEFNEIGFIGEPTPAMTYLLKNTSQRRPPPAATNSRGMQVLPQQSPRYPLEVPGIGPVGERRPFDPFRLEIDHKADGWHLVSGPHDLGALGSSEYHARAAMQIAQRFPLTEYVRVGTAGFGFFLSNGQAPRGVPLGVKITPFSVGSLTVRQTGNQWSIGDGRQTLGTFATADEARLAIKVIRHYGFTCSCEVGQGLRFLAKER